MSPTRSSRPPRLRASLARSRRAVVSVSLAIALLTATTAVAAEPAPAESARVRLLVEGPSLGEREALYKDKLGAGLRTLLEDAGYELDDSVNAELTVRVRLRLEDEANYEVDFDIAAGPEFVQLETLDCDGCTDEALLGQIEARYPELLEQAERTLDQASESRPIDASPPEPEEPEEITEEPEEPEEPPSKPFRALGIAGITVAAVGVGALIAGGVEFGRGRIFDEPTQAPGELSFVDHRPVGGALLGVGGVLLVSGVTVLVIDLVRNKKQRQHAARAQPMLGASIVGLSYAGRF